MKRAMIIGALVALALPGFALAATKFYEGKLDDGGKVFVTAKIEHGTVVQVRKFRWTNLRLDCDGNKVLKHDGKFTQPIDVDNKRFRATGQSGNGLSRATVKGKFIRQNRKVAGILRLSGDFPAQNAFNCSSGREAYSARR